MTARARAASTLRLNDADLALLQLGILLRQRGYHFTTVTPETHRRILARPAAAHPDLRAIFGWSRPFRPNDLEPDLFACLEAANALRAAAEGWVHAMVRFSSCGQLLLVHSAYPTVDADAVFFGPDSYRFLRFLDSWREKTAPRRAVDIGAGSGAAALALAQRFPDTNVFATDINEKALRFCTINAALNGIDNVAAVQSDVLGAFGGSFDLVVANPPYLNDATQRQYRHGGGPLGAELSLRILREGLRRLSARGRVLLYTGSAIVGGQDMFRRAAEQVIADAGSQLLSYSEIDPDVFGEELNTPAYAAADRIAAVGLVAGPRLRLQ